MPGRMRHGKLASQRRRRHSYGSYPGPPPSDEVVEALPVGEAERRLRLQAKDPALNFRMPELELELEHERTPGN